jgi:hypothetical protein
VRRDPAANVPLGLLLLTLLTSGCGKKGAPLAPLYLVPSSVGEVSARRVEDTVRLRFVLPVKNENGPGINLDRVEIYAVTVAPGGITPPNRELLTKPFLAGQIAVRLPPADGAAAPPEDTRPAPGDAVTFVEPLTSAVLQPPARKAPPAAPPVPGPPPATNPDTGLPVTPSQPKPGVSATDLALPAQPVRIYVVRPVARNGRPGPPSPRVQVPIGSLPSAPRAVVARNLEHAIGLDWLPALAGVGTKLPGYNVYRADAPDEPLNRAPLDTPAYEHAGATPDTEVCLLVRTVDRTGAVPVESAASERACVTPTDVFPPAPPQGLAAVSTPGAVQLIWNASTEKDLAGYLVLRADAPDETLQPLTPAPIRDAVYQDTTVTPGARYAYAIVAVDSATPPNKSTPSERVEAIAR